jgi:hypothetical protein
MWEYNSLIVIILLSTLKFISLLLPYYYSYK